MTEPVIAPYGDTAWLVEFSESTDRAVVHQLARDLATGSAGAVRGAGEPPGMIRDVTVGDRTLVVRLSAGSAPDGSAEERTWLDQQVRRVQDGLPGAPPSRPATVLPVTFDGEDLDAVAESAGLSTDRVISLLLGAELRVAFVGFAPGFAYLTGLPPPLSGIPRRATPRRSVPAGSVAIAGGFAAVYPAATPGGWHLVGHTPVRMFDPAVAPYALLAAGDRVRFRPEGDADAPESASASAKAPRPRLRSRSTRWVDVVEPGSLTLVQDAGRPGTAGIGVPEAGAADPESMVLANRLVGNEDGAAVLEIVGRGPVLRFGCPVHLAVVTPGRTGLDLRADGFSLPSDAVVPLQGGQLAELGMVRGGARAYLAVGGGFTTPVVLGSRSSDVLSGLGPGALRAGDRLELGPPTRPRGLLLPESAGVSTRSGVTVVRAVAGPHRCGQAWLDRFLATTWEVTPDSNRVGLRLRPLRPGPRTLGDPEGAGPSPVRSAGTVLGAVQLPPDGHPIVLSVDRATTGGYPVVACVVSADHALLGQLGAGDPVRFDPVTPDEARALGLLHRRAVDGRVTGWHPDGPAC